MNQRLCQSCGRSTKRASFLNRYGVVVVPGAMAIKCECSPLWLCLACYQKHECGKSI